MRAPLSKLHLGCGTDIKKGYVNVDIERLPGVDVVHDLNKFPYPFKDNSFDLIEMHHVMEHLDNPLRVIEELWRIAKKGGRVVIAVPHWSHFTAWGDLTHKRAYSSAAFIYYEINRPEYYSKKCNYNVLAKRFTATRTNYLWVNKLVNPLLNMSSTFTEMILCKFLPVSQIIFVLRAIK